VKLVNLKQYWVDKVDHKDVAMAFIKDTPKFLFGTGLLFLYPVIVRGEYAYLLMVLFYIAISVTVFRPSYESTHINVTTTTIGLLVVLSIIGAILPDFVANLVALWICLRFREALVFLMDLGVMEVSESKSRFRNK
jgi:branched-subunit amino acid ABC-type transport system permease component